MQLETVSDDLLFHLLPSQCLVTGTNEDISSIHMRMAVSFCYFFCHSWSLLLSATSLYHTLLYPGAWGLWFLLSYMKLIFPFVKSPLEKGSLRSGVMSPVSFWRSSLYLLHTGAIPSLWASDLWKQGISKSAFQCMYAVFSMCVPLSHGFRWSWDGKNTHFFKITLTSL